MRATAELQTVNVRCSLCGGVDVTPWLLGRDRMYRVPGTYSYVTCRTCGLRFMNPQVAPASRAAAYPHAYGPHASAAPTQNFARRHLSALLHAQARSRYFSNLSPGDWHLDVGCGSGAYLVFVQDSTNCKSVGVDISLAGSAIPSGRPNTAIIAGTVKDVPRPPTGFTLITAWWFFEHISDPLETLEVLRSLLAENGQIVLGVPNADGFAARLFRSRWFHLDAPRHLILWTERTLLRALHETGFEARSLSHSRSPMGLQNSILLAFRSEVDDTLGSRIWRSRALAVLHLPLTWVLSKLGLADELVVTASPCQHDLRATK